MLRVHVKGANNLQAVDQGGTSDPYCKVTYHGKTEKTEHVEKNLNPQWDKQFQFTVSSPVSGDAKLLVRVYDWNRVLVDKLIGQVDIYLRDIKRQGGKVDQKYPLTDGHGQSNGGTVNLAIMYDDPEKDQANVRGDQSDGAGYSETNVASDASKQAIEMRQRREEMLKKYPDKPLDFQVRVHVIEGRKLECKTQPLDPVANVFVGDENKGSRVLQDTDKPFWDEMFFFELKKKPSEVFDTICKFDVSQSRTLRKDALIGTFQMDLGMVYIENDHCFVHKWLLLTDPDDAQGGPRGYLKISIMLLGPGDEPVKLPKVVLEDNVDIESNLLRPAGVQLAPATMDIKVFRAEEVPIMDMGVLQALKNLFSRNKEDVDKVDPYVEVSFAGQKLQTKVIDTNANPEFNQKLSVGIKVPSMCDRIRIRVIDRDNGFGVINEDDVVGTIYIPVSQISAPGEGGFLPMFGPCFLNIYGGPRAFDLTGEFDYLNEGEMEGAAYRGRVLVQLETTVGQYPKESVSDLTQDDLDHVIPFLKRRKFSLHAVFFDATMLSKSDGPIEFEISVGNYGNKLDVVTMPMSSSTQPMIPTYNGDYYFYMPWNDTKPCCSVACQWEDISYRLESLSILEATCDHLVCHLKKFKELVVFEATRKQKASAVIRLLDQLIDDLSPESTIKSPEQSPTINRLDRKLCQIRKYVIETVREEAKYLRKHATDSQEAVSKCEGFLGRLKSVTYEAQNSFPDVIIWMLSSDKRIAYTRIPAHHLLYSEQPLAKGKLCNQMTTLYLRYHGKKHFDEDHQEIPAQLRVMMWLGLEEYKEEWITSHQTGQLALFAETFENQSMIPIKGWGTAIGRPDWSDGLGKLSMEREAFENSKPVGWEWKGSWTVMPPASAASMEADLNMDIFQEDLFEYVDRMPGSKWDDGEVSWRDVSGNVNEGSTGKDAIECPEGWQWTGGNWKIDMNRAVDEEGWEYSVDDSVGEYSAAERMYHTCRRRRWVRERQRTTPVKDRKPKNKEVFDPEQQWEYCKIFRTKSKFHAIERKLDMARRRRWLRKMVANGDGEQPLFYFKNPDKKEEMTVKAPQSFLTFEEPFTYELRVYLYQARDIRSGDESGMSDAYCLVSFHRRSQTSVMIPETLMPTWNQTLVFENIRLFEDPQKLLENPPHVVVEIFDKDTIAKDDFLGRVTVPVFAHPSGVKPLLKWYPVMYIGEQQGELLSAFELIATSNNPVFIKQVLPKPPQKEGKFIVPSGICPEMHKTRIEVLAWGVRNMKRYQLLSVDNPSVQLEVGGDVKKSEPIKNLKKNPNFESPLLVFKSVYLPKKRVYCPPLNIRIIDHRAFGRKPIVGLHCISSIDEHRVDDESLANFRASLPSAIENTTDSGARPAEPDDQIAPVPDMESTAELIVETDLSSQQPGSSKQNDDVTVPIETKNKSEGEQEDEEKPTEETEIEEEKYDWWSKYYASLGDSEEAIKAGEYTKYFPDNGRLQLYNCPLEDVPGFDGLEDLVSMFELFRGKGSRDPDDSASNICGKFKGAIKMYPLPEDDSEDLPLMFSHIPSTAPVPVIVRLYVVRAYDLTPKDDNGKNDAYLIIKLGKEKIDTRDNYIPNDIDPVFGSFFELKAVLPIDHELKIQIKDYDLISADDLIGETVIDLENRYLTKHRATVGIADEYYISGVNQWRDSQLPSELLAKACTQFSLPDPDYSVANEVRIGPKRYNLSGLIVDESNAGAVGLANVRQVPPDMSSSKDSRVFRHQPKEKKRKGYFSSFLSSVRTRLSKSYKEDKEKEKRERERIARCLGPMKERLALRALKSFGDPNRLIPEHVETRPLYSPQRPNGVQGRLEMWVDLFVDPAKNGPPPPPVNISRRRPTEYVMRLIIWNTSDVIMDETNLLGEAMSDIYVKGWIRGIDDKQKTDVHYRSLNGEGNFNWRFVFPFDYDPAEQCLVVNKKEHLWSLDKTEFRLPPLLTLQVWDADLFNPDDFLGQLEINLNSIPGPAKNAKKCKLEQMPEFNEDGDVPSAFKPFNIFERKHIRGWWPCQGQLTYPEEVKGQIGLTGKIEMEIEVVTKEEAELRPAGPARDDPNMNPTLEPPNRPDTSFLWFMNPWKTCKHLLWKRFKWLIITLLIVVVVVAFVGLFFYNFPEYIVKKLIGS